MRKGLFKGELSVLSADGKEWAQWERLARGRKTEGSSRRAGRGLEHRQRGPLLCHNGRVGEDEGMGEAGSRRQTSALWRHPSCSFPLVVAYWGQCLTLLPVYWAEESQVLVQTLSQSCCVALSKFCMSLGLSLLI